MNAMNARVWPLAIGSQRLQLRGDDDGRRLLLGQHGRRCTPERFAYEQQRAGGGLGRARLPVGDNGRAPELRRDDRGGRLLLGHERQWRIRRRPRRRQWEQRSGSCRRAVAPRAGTG